MGKGKERKIREEERREWEEGGKERERERERERVNMGGWGNLANTGLTNILAGLDQEGSQGKLEITVAQHPATSSSSFI